MPTDEVTPTNEGKKNAMPKSYPAQKTTAQKTTDDIERQIELAIKQADYILYRFSKGRTQAPADPKMPPNEIDDILERLDNG